MTGLTVMVLVDSAIDSRSCSRSKRCAIGFDAPGKRLRKNSGIAS